MASAKRAAIWQEDPVQSLLEAVSNAYTSKVNRFAMWTA